MFRATGLVGILALGTWAPAAGQEGAEARVTADRLNLREECGMSSPVLGVLTRDETVTLLGSELGTWVRVQDEDGVEGCVSTQYLEIGQAGAVEAEAMASPSEESSPYAWADLTDSDSAEIVGEIEALEADLAATSDPDEQEDLRQEITELEDDLRARQQELAEEHEVEAREAREAELAAREEAAELQAREARRADRRASGGSDWTGFYLGVNAGYGFGGDVFAISSLGTSSKEDVDGFVGGVQFGYSYQFDRFVLGAEGDYQLSNESGATGDLAEIGFPGSRFEIEDEWVATVRARAGFVVGQAMLYATGGIVQLETEGRFSGPLGDVLPPDSVSRDGLTVGVGATAFLSEVVTLKGEALLLDIDDEPELEGDQSYIARIGVSWHF